MLGYMTRMTDKLGGSRKTIHFMEIFIILVSLQLKYLDISSNFGFKTSKKSNLFNTLRIITFS